MTNLFFSVLLLCLVLAGCSSVKDSLGMTSANVDAYMIQPHDLTLPPDYKVRPPRVGETSNSVDSEVSTTAVEDVLKKS